MRPARALVAWRKPTVALADLIRVVVNAVRAGVPELALRDAAQELVRVHAHDAEQRRREALAAGGAS